MISSRESLAAALSVPAPPTTPGTSRGGAPVEEYEPAVGQDGKDVVWVPTPQRLVDLMLDMAGITPSDYLVDLGSGDGRVVMSAARRGTHALGIEYNPDLVRLARRRAAEERLSEVATFAEGDLCHTDLSSATVVTMFLLPDLNITLQPSLLALAPGTRVVSNAFEMADWVADETVSVRDDRVGLSKAFLWIVPARVNGCWQMDGGPLGLTQRFQGIAGTLGSDVLTHGRLRGNGIEFSTGDQHYRGVVSDAIMQGTVSGRAPGQWCARRE